MRRTFGTAILLIAVGAILRYAVNVSTEGFNVNTAGVILMVVGVIGLLLAVLFPMVRPGAPRPPSNETVPATTEPV